MRGVFIAIATLGFTHFIAGQTPTQTLNNWSAKSPIEKVYLHTDRAEYLAGETIWFKAYLYAEYIPDSISSVVYAELYDQNQQLVNRVILPVIDGDAFGDIDIPDTAKSGNYFIRAYSPTMLNHDNDFLYTKKIRVVGKGKMPLVAEDKTPQIEFFPEGGNLVNGYSIGVAYKITNKSGVPVNGTGIIRNQNGDSILAFESYHDGMGLFEIESKPGVSYYAQLTGDAGKEKFQLPQPVEKGIAFSLMPDPQGIYYSVKHNKDEAAFAASYMIGQMDHRVVFEKKFSSKEDWITGVINTGKLYSGILQVTVFNINGLPLAERLWFVDNKEYLLKGDLRADTLNFNKKALNHITLSIKDTIIGSFSLSITDPDLSANELRTESIISNLLLTSDLKGYIHNPAYYFSSDNDSVKTALDFVMMTNGWRRFKWVDLLAGRTSPVTYIDPKYISLRGQINERDSRKPVPDKELVVLIKTPENASNSSRMIKTDATGNYKLDSLIFYGHSRILFSDIRGKKSKWIDVINKSDSLSKIYPLAKINTRFFPSISHHALASVIDGRLNSAYSSLSAFDKTLEEVIVSARKKSPLELLDEKYASGMFSGDAMKTLDLLNADDAVGYPSIFEYIEARIPGVTVAREGFDYTIYYRQAVTMSAGGPIPMTIFLNEMQTDVSFISAIPVTEIAMVKIYNSFVAVTGNAPGGVLSIYTKKGSDLFKAMPSSADVFEYNGFSFIREFYSPNYSVDSLKKQNDHRITLVWKPDIYLRTINPVVPIRFYNNDNSKRFKVIIEGMTKDGKMLFLEKIFAAPPPKGF
jgi:hypothetical protein